MQVNYGLLFDLVGRVPYHKPSWSSANRYRLMVTRPKATPAKSKIPTYPITYCFRNPPLLCTLNLMAVVAEA